MDDIFEIMKIESKVKEVPICHGGRLRVNVRVGWLRKTLLMGLRGVFARFRGFWGLKGPGKSGAAVAPKLMHVQQHVPAMPLNPL